MKKLALATLLAATAMSANAYQTELGASITHVSPDVGNNATGLSIDGTHYLVPVQNIAGQPYNEQDFLQNASEVHGTASYVSESDTKVTSVGVGGVYYIPNTSFAAVADVQHVRLKFDGIDGTENANVTRLGAGYKPMNNLLLQAGAVYAKDGSDSDTAPYVGAKYLTKVGMNDMALSGDLALGDVKNLNLGLDYYLDPSFSVGAGYNNVDAGESNADAFSIRAKKFFQPNLSVEGSAAFGDDAETFSIRGAYRF